MSQIPQHRSTFRFYEELNDFLPPERRKTTFDFAFNGTPSVKDCVEAIGVPHPEVDLILVDDVSVGFDHLLQGGERVDESKLSAFADFVDTLNLEDLEDEE